MAEGALTREAFVRLKPMCDAFLKVPSKTTVAPLVEEYKRLQRSVLQEIQAYLLFPYVMHFRNERLGSTELKMALANAMREVFIRSSVDDVESFFKYFSLMVFQKFGKDSSSPAAIDEDFALSVVKTVTALTLGTTEEVRTQIYTRKHAPKLGQGLFVCVQLAKKERFRALRLASMNCILAICSLHDDLIDKLHNPKLNPRYGDCVGDILMFFLPGLLAGMQDVAKGDQKQGHAVTCLAIKTLSRILCLTLMDRDESQKVKLTNKDFLNLVKSNKTIKMKSENLDPFGIKLRAKGVNGMKEHLEKGERNRDWYRAAGERLTVLMKSLLPLQHHPHEKVRLETAYMCSDIVTYCSRNMSPSIKYILEMLIALSEDENENVVKVSKRTLEILTNNSCEHNEKHLLDILEENFNNVLTRLPRYLNKLDTSQQLSGIHLLKGYIRLLTCAHTNPQRLTKILSCTHVMNRLAIVLVEIFKLETNSIKLLEECDLRDVENPAHESSPWKIYTYLQNESSIKSALEICNILGASESVEIVVDYLLDQYRLDNEFKKEIILILNEILSVSCENDEKGDYIANNVILTYIDYENWYLPTAVTVMEKLPSKNETLDITIYNPHEWVKERTLDLYEGATDVRYTDISYRQSENNNKVDSREDHNDNCLTLVQAQNNVIQICLMTEGIGKIASSMKNRFHQYLLKTLYLILERTGSSVEAIHLAGSNALTNITKAFQFKDITELIKINADYFTHHVNVKLRKITDNAGVLDVLLVVMKYSETEVLPCLYEIVSNVLDQCNGPYPQKNINLFLKLFYTFIKYINSRFTSNTEQINDYPTDKTENKKLNNILYQLKEFQTNLNIINDLGESDEDTNLEDDIVKSENVSVNDENENEKIPPPAHVKMTICVLKRTINFLPSNNQDHKLLALDIINEGIIVIKDFEDELLPLVHQIWSPLVHRFKETSCPLIINRSFKLLLTLAQVSKDFIRRRTLKDVFSSLCDFLAKTSKDSQLKDVGSSYRFTQAYKLQLLLIQNLADLCINLNLQEKSVYEVMCVTKVYLNRKQPKPLQEACIKFFKTMSSHDVGACLLHLQGLWNDGDMKSCPEDLNLSNLNKLNYPIVKKSESKDYKRNVVILLEHLISNN